MNIIISLIKKKEILSKENSKKKLNYFKDKNPPKKNNFAHSTDSPKIKLSSISSAPNSITSKDLEFKDSTQGQAPLDNSHKLLQNLELKTSLWEWLIEEDSTLFIVSAKNQPSKFSDSSLKKMHKETTFTQQAT